MLLKALGASGGVYDEAASAQAFRDHFGYGGTYVGYIDLATRVSLNNHLRAQDEAMRRAKALPCDCGEMTKVAMVTKAMSLIGRLTGDDLREAFKDTVRITHGDDADVMAHGLEVLGAIVAAPRASGAYDQQLPAVSKLPALIAAQEAAGTLGDEAAIDSAVRMTSDHPHAIAHGRVIAAMMAKALKADHVEAVIAAGRRAATPEIGAHHTIATAPSYVDAVRRNIYAGGDSAGRSIIVGAILGAIHGVGGDRGVPPEWIAQLTSNPV